MFEPIWKDLNKIKEPRDERIEGEQEKESKIEDKTHKLKWRREHPMLPAGYIKAKETKHNHSLRLIAEIKGKEKTLIKGNAAILEH